MPLQENAPPRKLKPPISTVKPVVSAHRPPSSRKSQAIAEKLRKMPPEITILSARPMSDTDFYNVSQTNAQSGSQVIPKNQSNVAVNKLSTSDKERVRPSFPPPASPQNQTKNKESIVCTEDSDLGHSILCLEEKHKLNENHNINSLKSMKIMPEKNSTKPLDKPHGEPLPVPKPRLRLRATIYEHSQSPDVFLQDSLISNDEGTHVNENLGPFFFHEKASTIIKKGKRPTIIRPSLDKLEKNISGRSSESNVLNAVDSTKNIVQPQEPIICVVPRKSKSVDSSYETTLQAYQSPHQSPQNKKKSSKRNPPIRPPRSKSMACNNVDLSINDNCLDDDIQEINLNDVVTNATKFIPEQRCKPAPPPIVRNKPSLGTHKDESQMDDDVTQSDCVLRTLKSSSLLETMNSRIKAKSTNPKQMSHQVFRPKRPPKSSRSLLNDGEMLDHSFNNSSSSPMGLTKTSNIRMNRADSTQCNTGMSQADSTQCNTGMSQADSTQCNTGMSQADSTQCNTGMSQADSTQCNTGMSQADSTQSNTAGMSHADSIQLNTGMSQVDLTQPNTGMDDTDSVQPNTGIDQTDSSLAKTGLVQVNSIQPYTGISQADSIHPNTDMVRTDLSLANVGMVLVGSTHPNIGMGQVDPTKPNTGLDQADLTEPDTRIVKTNSSLVNTEMVYVDSIKPDTGTTQVDSSEINAEISHTISSQSHRGMNDADISQPHLVYSAVDILRDDEDEVVVLRKPKWSKKQTSSVDCLPFEEQHEQNITKFTAFEHLMDETFKMIEKGSKHSEDIPSALSRQYLDKMDVFEGLELYENPRLLISSQSIKPDCQATHESNVMAINESAIKASDTSCIKLPNESSRKNVEAFFEHPSSLVIDPDKEQIKYETETDDILYKSVQSGILDGVTNSIKPINLESRAENFSTKMEHDSKPESKTKSTKKPPPRPDKKPPIRGMECNQGRPCMESLSKKECTYRTTPNSLQLFKTETVPAVDDSFRTNKVISIPGSRCVARFPYNSGIESDLIFNEGDVIQLLDWVSNEWVTGQLGDTVGMFPLYFVDIEDADNAPSNDGKLKPPCEILTEDRGVSNLPEFCSAAFDFNTGVPGDLAFNAGQVITILERHDPNWLFGRIDNTGEYGIFPTDFVTFDA